MKYISILYCMVFLIVFVETKAQKDTLENDNHFYEPTISDLMDITPKKSREQSVSVASFKESTIRETPGIVTLITAEDIQNSGARDLIDLLRLVPGFDFAHDINNVIGLGTRGNWAHEGKFLLLVDGQSLNETNFGTFAFAQHVPLQNIARIEVIRGPGSAIYGGLAALAVINITTKRATDGQGVQLSTKYGFSDGYTSRLGFSMGARERFNNGLSYDFSINIQQGNFSNRTVVDSLGQELNFKDSSQIFNPHVNLGVQYKGLGIRVIYDNYEMTDTYNNVLVLMKGIYTGVDYKRNLSDNFNLAAQLKWKWQIPWNFANFQGRDDADYYAELNTRNNRLSGSVIGSYQAKENLNIIFGTQVFRDYSIFEDFDATYQNDERAITFNNIAAFGEIDYRSKFINLTIGGRVDKYTAIDPAFVPRIALTKAFENVHLKLLYSNAFKAPTIQNIFASENNEIKPEKIRSLEFEVGYRVSDKFSIVANIFEIRITDPIIYFFDAQTTSEFYKNLTKTGSRGFEVESRWKWKRHSATVNYSYYESLKNEVESIAIENNDKTYLGLPTHKVTLASNWGITKNLFVSPIVYYFSKRTSYVYLDEESTDLRLFELSDIVQLNVQISYNQFFAKRLIASLGLYNLLDQKNSFINPNQNGLQAIPDMGREYIFSLQYKLRTN